jgi:hypothetical protein
MMYPERREDGRKMILKSGAGAGLPSILHTQREGQKPLDVRFVAAKKSRPEPATQQMLLESAKQDLLAIHPGSQRSVRIPLRICIADRFAGIRGEQTRSREGFSEAGEQGLELLIVREIGLDADLLQKQSRGNPETVLFRIQSGADPKAGAFQIRKAEEPVKLVGERRLALRNDDEKAAILTSRDQKQITLPCVLHGCVGAEVKAVLTPPGPVRGFHAGVVSSDAQILGDRLSAGFVDVGKPCGIPVCLVSGRSEQRHQTV